jgi:serine/threonine protein kinase
VAAVIAAEKYCPTCERSFDANHGKRCPTDGTELVIIGAPTDPLLGRNLNDRYTIDHKLGAGGMGTVYRGTQHSVGREVAIKVVSPRLVSDPDAIKRFLREAKLASKLGHPNAVAILDFGQTPDGLFFLVMELLGGRTLDKVLRTDGRFSLHRITRIASQICDALEGAHRLDIVHRDLKPANVMLLDTERDLVKVLDFGLAKSLSSDSGTTSMTGSGALLGTPAYMSPEAALGRDVDARADLYSLGCMLYVLASGRMPFHAEHSHELISMQANLVPPPPPGVPAALSAVIMRLLEKDPAKRYQTAEETRDAIEGAVVASRTPFALETTLPQGLPAIPDAAMATTVDTIAPVHVAHAKAPATSESSMSSSSSVSSSGASVAKAKGVAASSELVMVNAASNASAASAASRASNAPAASAASRASNAAASNASNASAASNASNASAASKASNASAASDAPAASNASAASKVSKASNASAASNASNASAVSNASNPSAASAASKGTGNAIPIAATGKSILPARRVPIWIPLGGLAIIAGAVALFMLRGSDEARVDRGTTSTDGASDAALVSLDAAFADPTSARDAALVSLDAAFADPTSARDAALASTDPTFARDAASASLDAPSAHDALEALAVVDAAIIDAPKGRSTRNVRIDAGGVEATVERPDAAVVVIDAAPVIAPDADGKKTPW